KRTGDTLISRGAAMGSHANGGICRNGDFRRAATVCGRVRLWMFMAYANSTEAEGGGAQRPTAQRLRRQVLEFSHRRPNIANILKILVIFCSDPLNAPGQNGCTRSS